MQIEVLILFIRYCITSNVHTFCLGRKILLLGTCSWHTWNMAPFCSKPVDVHYMGFALWLSPQSQHWSLNSSRQKILPHWPETFQHTVEDEKRIANVETHSSPCDGSCYEIVSCFSFWNCSYLLKRKFWYTTCCLRNFEVTNWVMCLNFILALSI